MAFIRGSVLRVFHHKPGFTALSIRVHEGDPQPERAVVNAAGPLAGLIQVVPGATLELRGEWKEHPKFGRQLTIGSWRPYARNYSEAAHFLHTCVDGFLDWGLAQLIAQSFTDPFRVMTDEPQRVHELAGDDPGLRLDLEAATKSWAAAFGEATLGELLIGNFKAEVVRAVFRVFGVTARKVLEENPYRMVSVPGVSLPEVDSFALRMGVDPTDPRRVEGALLAVLHQEARQGHLYLPLAELSGFLDELVRRETIAPFGLSLGETLGAVVARLAEEKVLHVDPAAGVYLPVHWRHERTAAEALAKFVRAQEIDFDAATFLADYERSNRLELSDAQREAVTTLLQNRVLVLSGLPGTGKTSVVKALVGVFRELQREVTLMAPTGIAAKRLAAVTSHDASTIHRALRYDGTDWGYDAHTKFDAAAVIVDEVSMVDQELLYRLLDALHPETYLVLVGDAAQLPSVGPGNVLRELITCRTVPHVRLTQIFRQAADSAIVQVSHQVVRGDRVNLNQPRDSAFQFVPVPSEEQVAQLITQMARRLKDRDENFQVLAPKYDGAAGVKNLNLLLRNELNPDTGQPHWGTGDHSLRLGDRVMVVKNDYELNIYNGDMGKVAAISEDGVRVRIHGVADIDAVVDIPAEDVNDLLKLAYAITVHKSQGSEFGTILLPVVPSQGRMLQRNLLYTALTRAKKKVWVVGDERSFHRAVENDKVHHRYTVFGAVLDRVIEGRS